MLRRARPEDEQSIGQLLQSADLPSARFADWLTHFVVAEADGRLIGVAGLEVHASDGLLRSLCVAPEVRNDGIGGRLTAEIIKVAQVLELHRLYLLTTTADRYFPRFGFRRIDREDASPAIKDSVEFREACPTSAVAMCLLLNPGQEEISRGQG